VSNHPLGLELVGNHERLRLLEDLKRTVVEQLGKLPGELFAPIEARLQESIRQGGGAQERVDLAALLALRARSASFVMRYRELLARNFDDLRNRAGRDSHAAAMGLVEESDLDFHVAGQQVADAVSRHFARPLELLDQRFELLGISIGAPSASNPVGAVRLVGAIQQAFAGAELSETLRPLLFDEYERALLDYLGELYARLNGLMAQDGLVIDPRRNAPPATQQQQQPRRSPPISRLSVRRPRRGWNTSACANCCMPGGESRPPVRRRCPSACANSRSTSWSASPPSCSATSSPASPSRWQATAASTRRSARTCRPRR
jgi:hypothetical protein